VSGKGVVQGSPGVRYYDVTFTNTGTGIARNLKLNQVALRTLSGTGTVTYNAPLSPPLPATLGDVGVGASTTVRLYLNVPSTVTRFSIGENGQYSDVSGTTFNYSISQAVFP
jgi:hypothetical protein